MYDPHDYMDSDPKLTPSLAGTSILLASLGLWALILWVLAILAPGWIF